jgi:trigger factor
MATVTRENIGTLHDKITVTVNKEDYWSSFEQSLKKYAKSANIPGFRKGMVPSSMIRKMYGPSLFNDQVIQTASKELEEYLKKENLPIFAQPVPYKDADPLHMDMNTPGEYTLQFEIGLKPEFEILPLKNGTQLTKYKITLSEKTLDDEIARLQKRFGTQDEKETISHDDDMVQGFYEVCDASGHVAEGAEKKEDTELYSKFPAKLKDMLSGKKKGDTVVLKPSDIAEGEELESFLKTSLKQADAADQYFRFTIEKISSVTPAELNEELFNKVFPQDEIKDADAFREKLRQELDKEFIRLSSNRLQNEIYELLVHQTPIELPDAFLQRWMQFYAQEKALTDEEATEKYPGFAHQLRWTLISDKISKENNLNVSYEEVIDDIKKRVLSYFGMSADESDMPWVEDYINKVSKDSKVMDETYQQLHFQKLFAWLETQFPTVEQEIEEEAFFKLADPHAMHHTHAH